ncbi:hypothetical protein B0T25DRAFT_606569 [Lasiosphaeria hispida]|uniref:Ras-domain-containing protein n=1 Tax=Lasiosphaeria hispida TaxID=260671 RepID=A0AAJ0HH50_9PEZI|nr:hypothetical protein B0T25DRAFT_606569 [Lasiosphaeria hispida]
MGRRDEKPNIIRILILGSAGVGKNCLESRFTTMTYPPMYDPTMTLGSRRFLSLPPQPTPNLNLPTPHARPRPPSASSTISNPASARSCGGEPATPFFHPPPPQTPPPEDDPSSSSSSPTPAAATYLVEVTNYPALQVPKYRAAVLAKGAYDAVLLVYDVGSRASFEAAAALHAEIPLLGSRRRRRRHRRLRRTRSSIFGGGREGEGEPGEVVVALVGNKSDFDDEYASVDLQGDDGLVEKEAVMQAAEVEERGLVHPLFRESRVLEEEDMMPMSPRSARSVPVGRSVFERGEGDIRRSRSVASEGGVHRPGQRVSVFSVAKRGSLNLVPEEETREDEVVWPPLQQRRRQRLRRVSNLPPTPPEPTTKAIEKWLEIDIADLRPEQLDDPSYLDEERTHVGSHESESTEAAKRQVSRSEGEMLARSLLLNIPFFETSAKTGENVEEVFGAILREVLQETGREGTIEPQTVKRGIKAKPSKEVVNNSTANNGAKRVLRKERKKEEGRPEVRQEHPLPQGPPVLTLSFNAIDLESQDITTAKRSLDPALEDITEVDSSVRTSEAPEPVAPVKRRGSVLGMFKRVFTKKSAIPAPDVAV